MPKILVSYYSLTGNTEKMAKAIAEGLKSISGIDVELNDLIPAEALNDFDAIVLGAPTYHHNIPDKVKTYLEAVAVKKINLKGKVGAAFGSHGWSGEAPTLILEVMKNRFEMQIVEPPLILLSTYPPDPNGLEKRCQDFAQKIAVMFPSIQKVI